MALDDIRNYYALSDRLATAGMPTAEQFAEIAASGFEIVINLALPTSRGATPDEPKIVRELGLKYIPIPVVWEEPTRENLLQFFEVMEATRDAKVFVHCMANYRVSAFLFLYRVVKEHVPEEIAEVDLYHLWRPKGDWETFIEDNLPDDPP
jgi:protein tyrosine phosphatase (PTP) superfamily phosphohydrolase (DUF442 family)